MTSTPVPATCKVVLANAIATKLLAEVAIDLKKLDEKPKLVGFLANDDPAAVLYADWSAKTCVQNGFLFDLRRVPKEDIEEQILAANSDASVHGIIVYYPIFPKTSRQDQYIQQLVALNKDVEGLSHKYIFNMYQNIRFLDPPTNRQKSILPCTPLAVVKVLEHLQIYNSILPYGNRLFGKTITVINRSEVVGRPLAALLANDGAKVYSVDIDGVQVFTRGKGIKKDRHETHVQEGWTRADCLPLSDVVISGVPGDAFKVETDLIREGAACINFSSEKNFDGAAVKEQASIYVPAIGKVTIAVLLRNLLRLVQNQRETGSASSIAPASINVENATQSTDSRHSETSSSSKRLSSEVFTGLVRINSRLPSFNLSPIFTSTTSTSVTTNINGSHNPLRFQVHDLRGAQPNRRQEKQAYWDWLWQGYESRRILATIQQRPADESSSLEKMAVC